MWRVITSAAALLVLSGSTGRGALAQTLTSPTFTRDVAPIVFEACSGCHRPGGPGPFSLVTFDEVRQRARQIGEVTRRRFMPPFRATSEAGHFLGQRRLSEGEIDLLERWTAAGAPEGETQHLPKRPSWPAGWQLGTPDLVVTLDSPYVLRPDASDVFRIFAIRLPVDRARFVRGIEFHPGNARVVHHANMRLDYTSATRALDEADPAPGYDGLMPRSAVYPEGHFLGWTPGQIAPLVPADLAWRLDPDVDLVLQLHMQPTGAVERVAPSIGFFFADHPATRTPTILRLGEQGLDIPAGDSRHVVTDSYVLPVAVALLAIQPHTHYRAREVTATATTPDGRATSLIRIDDWDFRWQHVYRLATPLALPKGTVVAMRYVFDNSAENPRNPRQPPERVRWGQRTADEMSDLWLQVLATTEADRVLLRADVDRKMVDEDIIGYETMIEADPTDAELHDDVAMLYLQRGDTTRAIRHFRAALTLKPSSAAARFNLGTALAAAGELAAAAEEFRHALRLQPAYSPAHNNLAGVLLAQGRRDDAIEHFREAIRLDPMNVQAIGNVAWIIATSANSPEPAVAEAIRLAERAVEMTGGGDARLLDVLAAAYAASGRFDRALTTIGRALDLHPGEPLVTDIRRRQTLYRAGRPYVGEAAPRRP